MLQATCIGYIGSDAEVKVADGHEFTTFRIAHSDKWKDDAGNQHESTQWVDCTMDGRPNVVEFLKRGTLVFVSGSLSCRVYSSAKDRCMKAGITIRVRSLELIGGKADIVPSRLVDSNGVLHNVTKWFYVQELVRTKKDAEFVQLFAERSMQPFNVDRQGFVYPVTNEQKQDDTNGQDEPF